MLRDVSSWGGEQRDWDKVMREAELRSLRIGMAEMGKNEGKACETAHDPLKRCGERDPYGVLGLAKGASMACSLTLHQQQQNNTSH